MPRNPKICMEILEIFRKTIERDNMLLACTDEDLVMVLNQNLFVEHRISYRTFQRYKRRAQLEMKIPDADPLYIDLMNILRMAYVKLKNSLITAILDGHKHAKHYNWVMERKFKEWNINYIAPEEVHPEENPDEPIIEVVESYPTMLGHYFDKDNLERPKDIMPVHHAVFNNYVIPNPDYDGEEDDNTRAIKSMWQLKQDIDRDTEAYWARREEADRQKEEQRRLEQEALANAQLDENQDLATVREQEGDWAEEVMVEAKQPETKPELEVKKAAPAAAKNEDSPYSDQSRALKSLEAKIAHHKSCSRRAFYAPAREEDYSMPPLEV